MFTAWHASDLLVITVHTRKNAHMQIHMHDTDIVIFYHVTPIHHSLNVLHVHNIMTTNASTVYMEEHSMKCRPLLQPYKLAI